MMYAAVKSTGKRMGGEHVSMALAGLIEADIRRQVAENPKYKGVDIPNPLAPTEYMELLLTAEAAKLTLGHQREANATVVKKGIGIADQAFTVTINQAMMGLACKGLLDELRTSIAEMNEGLADSMKGYSVLLVGGSSRLHLVKTELQRLTGQRPEMTECVDTCIADGAAQFHAYVKAGLPVGQGGYKVVVIDCTNKTLGVRAERSNAPPRASQDFDAHPDDFEFCELIKAYTALPTRWGGQMFVTPDASGTLQVAVPMQRQRQGRLPRLPRLPRLRRCYRAPDAAAAAAGRGLVKGPVAGGQGGAGVRLGPHHR